MERDWCADYHCTANTLEIAKDKIEELEEVNSALRAEVERYREWIVLLNPCGHTGLESSVCQTCGYPDPPKMISALRAEVETERMRLVACGVVAMANTTESAKAVRIPKDNPYYSASLGDVEAALDREMKLRADLAAAVEVLWDMKHGIDSVPLRNIINCIQLKRPYEELCVFLARLEVRT